MLCSDAEGRVTPDTIRKVIIQILAWLLALVGPFGMVLVAFMTIVWVSRPGIDGILAVYAGLIGLEAIALAFLTSSRRPWVSHRLPLFMAFAITSVSAPFVMFAYAFVQAGGH